MNTILGASGQVGSAIVSNLLDNSQPVKGIVRNKEKADKLKKTGASVGIADIHDKYALAEVLKDSTTVFLLTPETGSEPDILEDTRKILHNYREAITQWPITKIVGLSSIGAQHDSGTGNLVMSYMLEHAFTGLPIKQIFVRPAYYFSNWLAYADTVKKDRVLPTFFPPNFVIPMISPLDVAAIVADILADETITGSQTIYELEGPAAYSSKDVADAYSKALGFKVAVQQVPRQNWEQALQPLGFSNDGVKNFIEMTEAVINGRASREGADAKNIKGTTSLSEYITHELSK